MPKTTSQAAPATVPRDAGGYKGQTEEESREGVRSAVEGTEEQQEKGKKQNPWEVNRGGPSEKWQPSAWKPGPARR